MGRRRFSPLTRRILTVNVVPLVVLVAGVLHLGDHRERLIAAELAALATRAEVFAGALAEGATAAGPGGGRRVAPAPAAALLRRLAAPTGVRARVYGRDGRLVADSRLLGSRGAGLKVEVLPPAGPAPERWLARAYDAVSAPLLGRRGDPPFPERPLSSLDALPAMAAALGGERRSAVWSLPGHGLRFGVAAPVQRLKRVLGLVLVTSDAPFLVAAVRRARVAILQVFGAVLAVTVLVSLYLARAITRPVRRLAAAADEVRRLGRAAGLPDLGRRRDEIGDLSRALREMTAALGERITANERFAADVAHELRNPLTSLRSAVETLACTDDPDRRSRLLAIVEDDVRRLDRMVADVLEASRLDAELARRRMGPVDVARLPPMAAGGAGAGGPRVVCAPAPAGCVVTGIESHLARALHNVVSNARSFTPEGGTVAVSVRRDGGDVVVEVEDEGPGIAPGSLEAVFERFYSERPPGGAGRRHSGLGLSISRQIVEAHRGTIRAENRAPGGGGGGGGGGGARVVIRLPAADGGGRA